MLSILIWCRPVNTRAHILQLWCQALAHCYATLCIRHTSRQTNVTLGPHGSFVSTAPMSNEKQLIELRAIELVIDALPQTYSSLA